MTKTTSDSAVTQLEPPALADYGLTAELVARKIARFRELRAIGRELALAGIRHQHPDATAEEILQLFQARLELSRREKWRNVCAKPAGDSQ